MTTERWAIVKDYPEYEVSDAGRVRKTTPKGVIKTLHPSVMTIGYMMIGLRKKKKAYIHRLVAEAFLPNPDNRATVNHKNLDRADNRLDNLEWATHQENINHARDIYGNYNAVGTENGKSKLDDDKVRLIRRLLANGIPQRTIAKQLGISRGPVSGISLNILWTHVK